MISTPCRTDLYPLLPLSAAFAIGIFFEHVAAVQLTLLTGLAALSILGIILLRGERYATLFLICAFVCVGSISYQLECSSINDDRIRSLIESGQISSSGDVEISGRLITPPEFINDGVMLTVETDHIARSGQTRKATGRVRLFSVVADDESLAKFRELELRYGSVITAAGEVSREEKFENPGVQSRIQLLDRAGIDANLYVKSPLLIEHTDDSSVFLPLLWAYDARQVLIEQFHTRFSTSTAGVLSASMLGERYFLDKSTADVFREGGTFHVLVISGLHITFIGGIFLLLVSAWTRNRWARFLMVSSALWAYSFAVGAEPPVVRASLMFTIALLGYAIGRQGNLLNSFGACLLLLLVWRPRSLFDPSLQLTVLSVASITMCAFPLVERLRSIGRWMPSTSQPFPPNVHKWLRSFCEMLYWNPAAWTIESSRQIWSARIQKSPYFAQLGIRGGRRAVAYIFEGLFISLIVQLWLLPLTILYFHRVAPASMLMNLWVGGVLALESFSALLAVAVSMFSSFLAQPLFTLTEFFNYLLITLPGWLTDRVLPSWRLPHYSGIGAAVYVVYFLAIIAATLIVWRWDAFTLSLTKGNISKLVKVTGAVLGLLVIIVVLHPFSGPRPDGRLHVDFLDVDQGDSALVRFPDGTTMLIDGGGKIECREDEGSNDGLRPDAPGVGEAVVSPFLWHQGYSHIDYIVATHADADHIQGLTEVAGNFDVDSALVGRRPIDDPEYREFKEMLGRRSVAIETVSRGRIMKIGGATVEFLYPRADPSAETVSDNNNSVVIRIVYGGRAFLFAGDIESAAEGELLSGGGTLRADVVKVPHHGSRTSSTEGFVRAAGAGFAIVSAGRHSRFGHPHREVTDRWIASGARVLTTSQHGMISFSTDGRDLVLNTFSKRLSE